MNGDFHPNARVIADSVNPAGQRLTTIEVTLHRFVLAQFNTHRALSRNSASSRAIPVSKAVDRLVDRPVYPYVMASEQRGMQGGDELDEDLLPEARQIWASARRAAIQHADLLVGLGVHKSIANRLLEPFMATTVIASATDWDNFFTQRCSPLAQPEIRGAALAMQAVYRASTPAEVRPGHWHLPYITAEELDQYGTIDSRKIAAARCARVSYLSHDGHRDAHLDLNLYHKLISAQPPHASPLEHVATPATNDHAYPSNFRGWWQLRHIEATD